MTLFFTFISSCKFFHYRTIIFHLLRRLRQFLFLRQSIVLPQAYLFSFNFWFFFFSPPTNFSWRSWILFTSASLGRPWLRKWKSSSPGIKFLTSWTPLVALSCTVYNKLWSWFESCIPWSGPDITLNAAFEPPVETTEARWPQQKEWKHFVLRVYGTFTCTSSFIVRIRVMAELSLDILSDLPSQQMYQKVESFRYGTFSQALSHHINAITS